MSEVLIQEGKQGERVMRILPTGEWRYSHPYCDKNDSHWYAVAVKELRASSGAFELTRRATIYNYYNNGKKVEIGEEIGQTNIFSFVAPQLISFAGVIGDKAYLFSRPLEVTPSGLVFPRLEDVREDNYSKSGLYFPVREIDADERDMAKIVNHFNSF